VPLSMVEAPESSYGGSVEDATNSPNPGAPKAQSAVLTARVRTEREAPGIELRREDESGAPNSSDQQPKTRRPQGAKRSGDRASAHGAGGAGN
jgi:hypothetical protein